MAKYWKVWKDCAKCHGDGMVLAIESMYGIDPEDYKGTPPEGTPTMVCPICNGIGKFGWGWIEESD